MSTIRKLLRRLRGPVGAEEQAEAQRMNAERKTFREEQLARTGPRGIPGVSTRDVDEPRR